MNQKDTETITHIHRAAFGAAEGEEIAQLAKSFLALPDTISKSVKREDNIVGNVMFTPFVFQDHTEAKCYLLAPCGVLPEYQGCGIGRELMESGIKHLISINADAVFVLGVPTFYPRYGFVPTDKQTPYPDLLTLPESWMVLELNSGALRNLSGITRAVDPILHSRFWDTSAYG